MKTLSLFQKTILSLAVAGPLPFWGSTATAQEKTSTATTEAALTKEAAPQLVLHLSAKKPIIHLKSNLDMDDCVEVSIKNRGKHTVTLVRPGEASDYASRTPIIGISIIRTNDKMKHPDAPPRNTAKRCGNFSNSVSLFSIAPGQQRTIGNLRGLFFPFERQLRGRGSFRVMFYYINDPTGKFLHPPGGPQLVDPRMRASTPCSLRSNEIILTVATSSGKKEAR